MNNSIVFLIYADKYNGYYSQRYSSVPNSEHWDNNTQYIYTSGYNMSPSLAVDNSFNTYAAWSSYDYNVSKYTLWFWQGTSSGTWPTTWKQEWTGLSENVFYPPITYYYYSGQSYIDLLAWGSSNNDIWQAKRTGTTWNSPSSLSLGYTAGAPNLTHETLGSGTPVEMWTNESQSPYLIEMGSSGLPKLAANQAAVQTSRAAEMFDKNDNSILRVDVTEPIITTVSGSTDLSSIQAIRLFARGVSLIVWHL